MAKQCLPFLLLLQVWLQLAAAHSIVEFLPGFKGPLPFHLETGYVGLEEAEDVQLFYYFIKSQRNPRDDPLLLWLTGGPGCSALSALVLQIGPVNFEVKEYNGSLPTLVLNPNSWDTGFQHNIFRFACRHWILLRENPSCSSEKRLQTSFAC
ncbi:hypothetical protein OIU78_026978 [Salix suchowensis]|nr:hypothetical protein OIU78_026978 [Salix suchowensis]KAJ6383592.1 hypothetical protein OIU78_026978 [Salix suchowensis]